MLCEGAGPPSPNGCIGALHRHQTLSCGFVVLRRSTYGGRGRWATVFFEGLRVGRCSVTASISGGGRDHLVANVVYEERTPNCRIRRGDPTERHGLVRPKRPYGKKGVVDAEPSTTVKRPHPLVLIVSRGPSSGRAPRGEYPPRVAVRGDGRACRVPLAAGRRRGDGL